jgi:S1-C subfamily serine protease
MFRVTGSDLKPADQTRANDHPILPTVASAPHFDHSRQVAQAVPDLPRLDSMVPDQVGNSGRAGLPSWLYASLGAAGALNLISVCVIIGSFRGATRSELARPALETAVAQAPPALAGRPSQSAEQNDAPALPPRARSTPPAPPADSHAPIAQAESPMSPEEDPPPAAEPETGRSAEQRTPPFALAEASRSPQRAAPPVAHAEANASREQANIGLIERGKLASALVEVSFPDGKSSGSAFCISKSGRFITNSHVVEKLFQRRGELHLVLDIGLKSQRIVPAKVLRNDDYFDLALLKVDADSRLQTLELGDDKTLVETAPVLTFGFPFGQSLRVGHENYPNCTVISSKVTALHGSKERREGVQFDGQINPGNSGGAVVDSAGRVVGIAVATIPGKSINLAIPVGRLSDFLAAPGVVFNPPAVSYHDRARPVNWSIRLDPPAAGGRMPAGVSVRVTIAHSENDSRTCEVRPMRDGTCRVQVTPVPRDPPNPVRAIEAVVEAKRGSVVLATVHRTIEFVGAPQIVAQNGGERRIIIFRTLPRPPMFGGFGPRVPGMGGLGTRIPGMGGLGSRVPGMGGLGTRIPGMGGLGSRVPGMGGLGTRIPGMGGLGSGGP